MESEEHFLIDCPPDNRTAFILEVTANAQFFHLDTHGKFIYLMSQEDAEITKELSIKVHRWLKSRRDFDTEQKVR